MAEKLNALNRETVEAATRLVRRSGMNCSRIRDFSH